MKRLFLLLLFGLNMAGMSAVHAEKADSTKKLVWEADHADHDDAKQLHTLTGNVVITRGTMTLKADKVTLTEDPAGYTFATLTALPGKVATFRQKRDGGTDLWMEGEAERSDYDSKTEMLKLIKRARMRRLDGSKPSDEVEGEFISYDSRAEFFTVANTASGESRAGAGRVKGVIQPHTEAKGK